MDNVFFVDKVFSRSTCEHPQFIGASGIEHAITRIHDIFTSARFFIRFKSNLMNGSTRSLVFDELLMHNNSYLNHYVTFSEQYISKEEIIQKYKIDLLNEIRRMAKNQCRYKFNLYMKFNPTLTPLNLKYI